MDKLSNLVSGKLLIFNAGLGALFAWLIGGVDAAMKTLILFMILDFITGFAKGIYKKEIKSGAGWASAGRGGLKKLLMFVLIIVAYQIDTLFKVNLITIMGKDLTMRLVVIWIYIINEAVSITENCGECDVLVPKPLYKFILALKGKLDEVEVIDEDIL